MPPPYLKSTFFSLIYNSKIYFSFGSKFDDVSL